MSEWITDRKPTSYDAMPHGYVWVTDEEKVKPRCWNLVFIDEPWKPMVTPEPYVASKSKPKYFVMKDMFYKGLWAVYDGGKYVTGRMPTQEAAERIAAIYNEVMP